MSSTIWICSCPEINYYVSHILNLRHFSNWKGTINIELIDWFSSSDAFRKLQHVKMNPYPELHPEFELFCVKSKNRYFIFKLPKNHNQIVNLEKMFKSGLTLAETLSTWIIISNTGFCTLPKVQCNDYIIVIFESNIEFHAWSFGP